MQLTKVISTAVDKVKRRLVKIARYGKDDIQTPVEAMPYGTDANPIADMIAVYSQTSEKGNPVIIGYINKNQLAGVGEHRTYSTDADGVLKFYIWQKNDGTCEIGGNSDFMVRFNKLKSGFDKLKADFNSHIHTGNIGAPTSPPTVATTASIDDAKIEEIKTL